MGKSREDDMTYFPPEQKLLSYELRTVLNPEGWAKEQKRKGLRATTIAAIEHRKQNRHTIKEVLLKDKTGFNMNSLNGWIAVEVLGPGFTTGALEPILELKNTEGKWSYYTFKLLRPLKILTFNSYVAETSKGIRLVEMVGGLAKLHYLDNLLKHHFEEENAADKLD